MKEKIKVEEMFHIELRSVAEECYLTNLNKKKSVIILFDISQQLNSLIKKEEKIKEIYHIKLTDLSIKNKKLDKKKKANESKNNNNTNNYIDSINKNYLNKFKDLKMSIYKKEINNEIRKSNTIQSTSSNSSSTSKKKIISNNKVNF